LSSSSSSSAAPVPTCPRCGKEVDPQWEFCRNCGFDAQKNMMMPLFVASATRKRLFRLGGIWVLALVFTVSYTLVHSLDVGLIALVFDVGAIGTSFLSLRQRVPYSYEFFEDFVRVTYPSSFTHLTTARVPYSTIDDFICERRKDRGAGTSVYEFSVKGSDGERLVVRNLTGFGGAATGDFALWIEGRIPVPVRKIESA
jgi:zinc-ribbon domain